jgi:hypothetical protein
VKIKVVVEVVEQDQLTAVGLRTRDCLFFVV